MDLVTRLNKIQSDLALPGGFPAFSGAAAVLLDKNNEVQLSAYDLPGTFARIAAAAAVAPSGVPVGSAIAINQKFSFTAAQIAALGASLTGDLPIIFPARTVVLTTTVKHSASVVGSAVAATGTLTSDNTNVANNDTVTIGPKTYTFKTALTPTEGEVLIGASADASLLNLINAINHTGTPGTDYSCAAAHISVTAAVSVTAHAFAITAIAAGTGGNAIATTETSAHLSWGGATLAGGSASGITACTARLISTQNSYGTAFDVFQAAGAEVFDFYGTAKSELMGGPSTINLHLVAIGANLSTVTTGAIDAWITWLQRP